METGNGIETKKGKENLISIIVPVYNGEQFLERCVQSVLAQTYGNWELVLIDGASKDATPLLCKKWAEYDKRIRTFVLAENNGVSAGRNIGIRASEGEYLMFLDADDWLMPDCLERLYQDMQEQNVQIAGCSFKRCTDSDWQNREMYDAQEKESVQPVFKKRLIAGTDFLQEGILQQDTRCWSKLYHRSVVKGHFFREDFTIGEDMLFLWETAREAKLISTSEYPGYCYYYNENGTMLKPFRESDIDQIRCWKLVLETIEAENAKALKEQSGYKYDTNVISRTGTILLVSCMLVAGKLSRLPARERKKYSAIRKQCSNTLKEAVRIPGAYVGLDKKYRVKTAVFYSYPGLYLSVYRWLYRCYIYFGKTRK